MYVSFLFLYSRMPLVLKMNEATRDPKTPGRPHTGRGYNTNKSKTLDHDWKLPPKDSSIDSHDGISRQNGASSSGWAGLHRVETAARCLFR